jgi:uncharacterized protein (TIGR02996 family)
MILASPAAVGLLRAIVEDPSDDMPRLLLADVLEEVGEGQRAEFIRVGCELARLDATGYPTADAEMIYALRRRERELINLHGNTVLGELPPCYCWSVGDWTVGQGFYWWIYTREGPNQVAKAYTRRGFVASVTLTCADWCGKACNRKRHDRGIYFDCPDCNGTGRTGGHGPALVLAAPIEEVVLGGVQPREVRSASGSRWWFVGDTHVPAELLNLANQSGIGIPPGHTTPQVALAALFRAALAWARQEAGLPALP